MTYFDTFHKLSPAEHQIFFEREELIRLQSPHFEAVASTPALAPKFEEAQAYLEQERERFKGSYPNERWRNALWALRPVALVIEPDAPWPYEPYPPAADFFEFFNPGLDRNTMERIMAELAGDDVLRHWFQFDMEVMERFHRYDTATQEGLRLALGGGFPQAGSDLKEHVEVMHYYNPNLHSYGQIANLAYFPSLDLGLMVFELGYSENDLASFQDPELYPGKYFDPIVRRRWQITKEYRALLFEMHAKYRRGEITLAEMVRKVRMPRVTVDDWLHRDIDFFRHYLAFKREGETVVQTYQRREAFLKKLQEYLSREASTTPILREPDAFAVSDTLTLAKESLISAAGSVHETVEARGRPRAVSRTLGGLGGFVRSGRRFAPDFRMGARR
ncbi:MAG: hypothetical protein Q7T11_04440 [Deltaproteobacteria bacterium]|nr:hypothetical protein [Deltaproteobacteria bacterium]